MIKIEIKWLQDWERKIDVKRFKQIEKQWLRLGAELLKWAIQEKTPVDTWLLRQSYKIQNIRNWVKVYNTKQYWLFIHEGTKPHRTSVKNLTWWAKRHNINPYALQKIIARKWTKWRKWIPKVLEKKWDLIAKQIWKFILKKLNNV